MMWQEWHEQPPDTAELHRTLGRIEGTLEAMREVLEKHTSADEANFKALTVKLDKLDVAAAVRRTAWKWAAGVAAFVATAAQVAQAFGLF